MTFRAKNIQAIALAFALILMAFGGGMNFSEWTEGRDPTMWHFIFPVVTIVIGFVGLATNIWARSA
jgi:hypothetical protein